MKLRVEPLRARLRAQPLRFEQLETRTLMSATPADPMANISLQDIPLEENVAADTSSPDAFSQLTDRVGPVTLDEYRMLVGNGSDFTVATSSYGGDPPVNTAPTTTGISNVTMEEDGFFTPVAWSDYFDDAQDGPNLTYLQVANTNSSVAVAYCGGSSLDIGPVHNASGFTDITIRATDSGGLWVETTFRVTVTAVNDPPVIAEFNGYGGDGDVWVFSGTVTDVDDDVAGMQVALGGVVASYGFSATVQSDGSFSVGGALSGPLSGIATAQTTDAGGAASNVAGCWVYVS